MREIKFRVWNPRSAPPKMLYWGEDFFDLHLKYDSIRIKVSPENEHFELTALTDGITLMQYTGLKDSDGKEIYEGDIIVGYPAEDLASISEVKGEVFMDCGCFSINTFFAPTLYKLVNMEIIGNIYENPGLASK